MTKPISISDVEYSWDLYPLYAERDLDGDGKLGPGEVSLEEIHEGDVALGGNSNGYLSPWEVMLMRRDSPYGELGDEELTKTLYANEYLGVFIDDGYQHWNVRPRHFWGEVEINGAQFTPTVSRGLAPHIIFRDIWYYRNGNIESGRPVEDIPNPYDKRRPIRRDERAHFTPDGKLIFGSIKCFKGLFPDIELFGTVDSQKMVNLIRVISLLTSDMRKGINRVRIAPRPPLEKDQIFLNPQFFDIPKVHNLIAGANLERGEVFINQTCRDADYEGIILHEAAHLHSGNNLDDSFFEKWRDAAGDVYGPKYSRFVEARRIWNSGACSGPRYGCVSPYGCWNEDEDIATQVEEATTAPGAYRSLLDPTSDYYVDQPDQRPYAAVYRKKLELLKEYNFISEEIYAEITAPIMDYKSDSSLEAVADAALKYDKEGKYSAQIVRKACMKARDPLVADRLFRTLLELGAFEEAEQVMTYLLWEKNLNKREVLTVTLTDFSFHYVGEQPIPKSLIATMLRCITHNSNS